MTVKGDNTMEILTLGLFCAGLILCIFLKFSILYALGAGLVLFWMYGRWKGFSWKSLFTISLAGIMTAKNILLTFLLIGVMTALWRAAGTIPVIVSFASTLIRPSILILMTFLLNCMVSMLTGTSFGTAATMGVICGAIVAALTLFFRVDTVVVTGLSRYTAQEVQDAAGIRDGDNLLLFNKYDMAPRIVSALPYIEEVRINRKLPDTLLIEARECRRPFALVQGGSVAGPMLHKRVASDLVTLVDFAHTAFGAPTPLPVYLDDEGTPASDAMLIENGILTGYMNSRQSAARYGVAPAGNARAWLYNDEPLIRMRNTCILPGKSKLEDMIASIDDGYYLIDSSNGQADLTGEFMFGVSLGYEIKKGKLGRALLDTTVSGVAFDMLRTVDMVSDNITWSSSGFCGKKQPMPVGMGGPEMRCRILIGGR